MKCVYIYWHIISSGAIMFLFNIKHFPQCSHFYKSPSFPSLSLSLYTCDISEIYALKFHRELWLFTLFCGHVEMRFTFPCDMLLKQPAFINDGIVVVRHQFCIGFLFVLQSHREHLCFTLCELVMITSDVQFLPSSFSLMNTKPLRLLSPWLSGSYLKLAATVHTVCQRKWRLQMR